ncbi:hypothetical protein Fcan01_21198, partial [Folsomia candida]
TDTVHFRLLFRLPCAHPPPPSPPTTTTHRDLSPSTGKEHGDEEREERPLRTTTSESPSKSSTSLLIKSFRFFCAHPARRILVSCKYVCWLGFLVRRSVRLSLLLPPRPRRKHGRAERSSARGGGDTLVMRMVEDRT